MARWQRITCAVDLSPPSRVALEQASALARQLGAELTLVHVHAPPGGAADAPEKAFERWRADAEALAGAPVRGRFLYGEPSPEILREIGESRCQLLVVGTHGRGRVSRLLLGSVAERLVRDAPCPVFVARDGALEAAGAAGAPGRS